MNKLLLVEDSDLITKLYKEKLEKEGFSVVQATTIKEAEQKLPNVAPDLILLDVMFPGGENGFDFLERIKKNEQYKKIPVIVVTNLDDQEKIAKEIGADECLVKANISLEYLLTNIKKFIK